MSRQERFSNRDWAWSVFHRAIPHPARMIDIDYCEFCAICSKPLILGEVARDVGQQHKATSVLHQLCNGTGIIGIRVFYDREAIAEAVAHVIGHEPGDDMPQLDAIQLQNVWQALSDNPEPILRVKYVYPESDIPELKMTAKQFRWRVRRTHIDHELAEHSNGNGHK